MMATKGTIRLARPAAADSTKRLVIEISRAWLAAGSSDPCGSAEMRGSYPGRSGCSLADALKQAWEILLCLSDETVECLDPQCSRVSLHEQALVMGLDCLRHGYPDEIYEATMASVLPAGAVPLIRPVMQQAAATLPDVEPGSRSCRRVAYPASLTGAASRSARHRGGCTRTESNSLNTPN